MGNPKPHPERTMIVELKWKNSEVEPGRRFGKLSGPLYAKLLVRLTLKRMLNILRLPNSCGLLSNRALTTWAIYQSCTQNEEPHLSM